MPGRKYQASLTSKYRFSINGQEKSDELNENLTTALYWEYDSRIVRRWNVDPKTKPWESPYACFGNNPILLTDVLGDEANSDGGKKKKQRQNNPTPAEPNKTPLNTPSRMQTTIQHSEQGTHKLVLYNTGELMPSSAAAPKQTLVKSNPLVVNRTPGLDFMGGGSIVPSVTYARTRNKPNQTAIKVLETGGTITENAEAAFNVLGKKGAAEFMGKANSVFTYGSMANNALSGNYEGLASNLLDFGISKTPAAPFVYGGKILYEVFAGNTTMSNAYVAWDEQKKTLINNFNYYQQQGNQQAEMDKITEQLITIERGQNQILKTLQGRQSADQ